MIRKDRKTTIALAIAALALLSLFILLRERPAADKPVVMSPGNAPATVDPNVWPTQASQATAAIGAPSVSASNAAPIAKPEQPVPPTDEGWPYSPDTLPLVEAIVPGEAEWDDVTSDAEGTYLIRVRPASYFFRAPAPIVIELEVLDKSKGKQKVTRAEAQIKSATGGKKTPVDMDAKFALSPDGVYRATFAPNETQQKGLMGHVMLQAQVQLSTGKSYIVASSFMYTRDPDGRITGNYRDEMRDGSLYIAMSVQIDKPGLFQIRGELFGPQYQPIAETRLTKQLEPGEHRLELHVYGKAIVDRALDGPYRLRYLYLSQGFPEDGYEAIGPILTDAHTTQAYPYAKFTSAKYEAPAAEGLVIGPGDPSQANKPPPLFAKRPEGPPVNVPTTQGSTMPMGADTVTADQAEKMKEPPAASATTPASATAGPQNVGPPPP